MVPQGIGSIAPRTLAGRLTDSIGPRLVVLAGIALAAVGTIPFALAGLHTSYWLLGAALVVRGAGLGLATIAVMAGAFQGLSREQVPHASSATRILQFVGGSFGAAVLVAVILDRQAAAHAAAGAAGLATAFAQHVLVVHRLHGPGPDPGAAAGRPAQAGEGRRHHGISAVMQARIAPIVVTATVASPG